MVSIAQTRQALRKAFRSKRLALSCEQQNSAALSIVEQYKTHRLFQDSKNVAIYLSFNGELDTSPLIEYLWSQQLNVYLPLLHPFAPGYLLFQRFTPTTRMIVNHFGIREPALDVRYVCPVKALDILFTPLVAFDVNGNRLGMGGGFYDRTLSSLNKNKAFSTMNLVGLAHELQLAPSIPAEPWDIALSYVLTSNKLYSFV